MGRDPDDWFLRRILTCPNIDVPTTSRLVCMQRARTVGLRAGSLEGRHDLPKSIEGKVPCRRWCPAAPAASDCLRSWRLRSRLWLAERWTLGSTWHGQVFANAQSGNIVLMGVALASRDVAGAATRLPWLLAFVIGALASRLSGHLLKSNRLNSRNVRLGLVCIMLVVLGLCADRMPDAAGPEPGRYKQNRLSGPRYGLHP